MIGRGPYFYRKLAILGQGGMADVFQCDLVNQFGATFGTTRYAVKILRERWDRGRFVREASVLAGLRHPHLIRIVAYHFDADPPFYVMPVMKETLADHLLAMKEAHQAHRALYAIREYLRPVADAVRYLHGKGVVHRDIKPGNILLDASGRPILADLSICHVSRFGQVEQTWCGMGTAHYTAPETLRTGRATARSDIFSLGVVLYEMLTGRVTPEGYWWLERQNLPSVHHPRSCHPYVDAVIANMTHPDPSSRYQGVAQVMTWFDYLTSACLPALPAYVAPPPPTHRPGVAPSVAALFARQR